MACLSPSHRTDGNEISIDPGDFFAPHRTIDCVSSSLLFVEEKIKWNRKECETELAL